MSRFAIDPKWLIYLPPTMSPPETSKRESFLEYPDEVWAFYRKEGLAQVICEQKHMGSRAVAVLCRDEEVSQKRFGVVKPALGAVYTRTGRRFFMDEVMERAFLARLNAAAETSGLWEGLTTDRLCLDCELMPWSAKAQELLRDQYAPVGDAGSRTLAAKKAVLAQTGLRLPGLEELAARTDDRLDAVERYVRAYGRYCWPVHTDKTHIWHMEQLARLCAADPELLLPTPFRMVDLGDETSCADATAWWVDLTSQGREGMVTKLLDFIATGRRGVMQPAIKCRGPEYLRIINGPEYLLPANLGRLRAPAVDAKRSLALREFALGLEALERFVRREPLRRTHECVFGILALESEPVAPRL